VEADFLESTTIEIAAASISPGEKTPSCLASFNIVCVSWEDGGLRQHNAHSVQCFSFGMCLRRAEIKLHRLPQEHFQAQPMALGSKFKISPNIVRDFD
jgi:hypothetical protein